MWTRNIVVFSDSWITKLYHVMCADAVCSCGKEGEISTAGDFKRRGCVSVSLWHNQFSPSDASLSAADDETD